MDLELRIEKINSEFINSNKNSISEKDLKELMDNRESELRAIAYPYESLAFEREFSTICTRYELRRFIYFKNTTIPPIFKNQPVGFPELDKGLKETKQIRLLASELLTKKDPNPEFTMKYPQMDSVVESFRNPFPKENLSKQTHFETKAATKANNSKPVDPVLKFIILLIMIIAGLGSIMLFFLRLGLFSS